MPVSNTLENVLVLLSNRQNVDIVVKWYEFITQGKMAVLQRGGVGLQRLFLFFYGAVGNDIIQVEMGFVSEISSYLKREIHQTFMTRE